MARRKKTRRRYSRGINIISALESFALLEVASQGILGGGLSEVLGGPANIGYKGTGTSLALSNPGGVVSIRDFLSDPGASFDAMQANFMASWLDVAIKSAGISVAFKFGKKILAPTRRRANMLLKQVGLRGTVHF